MKRWLAVSGIAVGLAIAPVARAEADVITFNGLSGMVGSYTEAGVTFTAPFGMLDFEQTPNGTTGLLGTNVSGPFSQIRASIAGGTSFVSVDLGDYGADADLLVLRGYDSVGTLLGMTSLLNPSGFRGMTSLSLNVEGITSAVFGAEGPALNGSSVYADNFRFGGSAAPVPEPATMLLLGAGLAGGAVRRWKQRRRRLA